jgi:hypothetical protein
MIQLTEPRVGENKSLLDVVQDALDFLRQLRQDQVIISDEALRLRTDEGLQESRTSSASTPFTDDEESEPPSRVSKEGFAGGIWFQTAEELEYGLRCAWKHSWKCITRSEYRNLRQEPMQQYLRRMPRTNSLFAVFVI